MNGIREVHGWGLMKRSEVEADTQTDIEGRPPWQWAIGYRDEAGKPKPMLFFPSLFGCQKWLDDLRGQVALRRGEEDLLEEQERQLHVDAAIRYLFGGGNDVSGKAQD